MRLKLFVYDLNFISNTELSLYLVGWNLLKITAQGKKLKVDRTSLEKHVFFRLTPEPHAPVIYEFDTKILAEGAYPVTIKFLVEKNLGPVLQSTPYLIRSYKQAIIFNRRLYYQNNYYLIK